LNIQPGGITGGMIAGNAINSSRIMDGEVTQADLASGSVGTDELQNGAVTPEKLADGSLVTSVNGFTDDVTIVGDGGITVGSNSGQIVISFGFSSSIRWKEDVE